MSFSDITSCIPDVFRYDPRAPLIFNSAFFLVLFTAFLLLYYALRKRDTARIIYVVLFSLYFYYKSSGTYAILLLLTATVDFIIGRQIFHVRTQRMRRGLLILSMVFNLGMLCYFKYTNFLLQSFTPLLSLLGFTDESGASLHFDIFLPVGISFFTFQSMSYVIDIYRGRIQPLGRWIDYLFFVSFFPQLVAGPIVRAADFIPQIHRHPWVTKSEFGEGLFLIMCGLLKKGVISDYVSLNFVDRVFDAPTLYTGFENLMAIYGYAIQIYCDFSGYSDIAIGIALWLGFRFNINFDQPYTSATITEFWRRWHISLSSWLKDYLYISLGGNRKGKVRTYLNLIITMLLGGLWHGANLRFIIWGLLHGVALALHKLLLTWMPWLGKTGKDMPFLWRAISMVITFHFVCFAWIFFRMPTLEGVSQMLTAIAYDFHPEIIPQFFSGYQTVSTLLVIGIITHFIPSCMKTWIRGVVTHSPLAIQVLLLSIVIIILTQFHSAGVQPFIYFQF